MDAQQAMAESACAPDMTGERLVRAIAISNRLRIVATEAEFRTEMERVVGLAAPYIVPDRPALVVLGELLGLPAALTGPRALLARRARSSRAALSLLALAHARRILAYRRRWPAAIARELRPSGARANQYRESVVWADLTLAGEQDAGS